MNRQFIPGKEIIERVNKYVRFAAKRFARYDWEVWMEQYKKWINATSLRIRGEQDIKRFKWAIQEGWAVGNVVAGINQFKEVKMTDEEIDKWWKNAITEDSYNWEMIIIPRIDRVYYKLFDEVTEELFHGKYQWPNNDGWSEEIDVLKAWKEDLHRKQRWIPFEKWMENTIKESNEEMEDADDENPFLKRSEITETRGDLFDLGKKYALVHCIAQDAHMGAGIALQFRNKYPRMQAYIKRMKPNVGDIVVYHASRAKGDYEDRIIVNLVTKKTSWDKPTYESLEETLNKLEEWQRKTENPEVGYLGMPRIGSGLDKLHWDKVHEMIERIFYYSVVSINIRDGK